MKNLIALLLIASICQLSANTGKNTSSKKVSKKTRRVRAPKTYRGKFNKVYKHELYYSSYYFLKKSVMAGEKRIPTGMINRVLDAIHPAVFINDPDLDKLVSTPNQIDYAVGLREFYKGNHSVALSKLIGITPKSSMFVEASYILGLIYYGKREMKNSLRYFGRCVIKANNKKANKMKTEEYRRVFRNRCIQQVARIYFEQKNYKKSLRYQRMVEKTDYIWPRFIFDMAWNYYWQKDLPRVLGVLLTFKAPVLNRYMVPEANYLRALAYYDYCYYEKVEKIYNEFDEGPWRFRKFVKRYKDPKKLIRLMSSKRSPTDERLKFLHSYLRGFKKDIQYLTVIKTIVQIKSEVKKLKALGHNATARRLKKHLRSYLETVRIHFDRFLVSLVEDYNRQIYRTQSNFTKMRLTMGIKKRKLLFSKKELKFKDDLKNISLSEIKDTEEKFIWEFIGGFWADELGDYALAIKNQCGEKS